MRNQRMQNKAGKRHGGKARGFLTALGRDVRGNTLAIVAAALIPLTAMIGSGLGNGRPLKVVSV